MTAQEAAHKLLTESKTPMSAMALAKLALERQLVFSYAKKKAYSVAQTIEKNVRDGTYNNPKLKFVYGSHGTRLLALHEWENHAPLGQVSAVPPAAAELRAQIRPDLLEQVKLAAQSKIADDFDSTVAYLLRRGLSSEATKIREGLMKQLKQLTATERSAS